MNILYISNISGNKFAGTSVIIPKTIEEQRKKNYVYWVNLNKKNDPKWCDCANVFFNLDTLPRDFFLEIASKRIAIDIIVIHEVYVYGFFSKLRPFLHLGIPYIIVPHSQLTREAQKQKVIKKAIANSLFYKRFIKKAACIQYLSEGERESSECKYRTRNYVAPNGISVRPNQKNHRVPRPKIKSVFVGRIDIYQKGLDLLVEAISITKEHLQKAGFELIIYGPSQHHSKEKLESKIGLLGLDSLVFINDPVYDQEKEKVLEEADCFILTSRFEGHPVSLIEALSYGVPCLVSTGTYMDKEIINFKAGWVCDCNAESIAVALKSLVNDLDSFPTYSYNAVLLAQEYDWDAISNKNEREYLKIIGRQNG